MSERLDAEVIGRLCECTALDEILPLDVWKVLSSDKDFALGQMARIVGELYEEMEAARDAADAAEKWKKEAEIALRVVEPIATGEQIKRLLGIS